MYPDACHLICSRPHSIEGRACIVRVYLDSSFGGRMHTVIRWSNGDFTDCQFGSWSEAMRDYIRLTNRY